VVSLFRKIVAAGIATEAIDTALAANAEIVRAISAKTQKLFGRSLAIREVDAGSCNGCELEATALGNPVYDCERFGLRFVASPRHADLVVAVGDCARTCGAFKGSYAVAGSVDQVIPVDVFVSGCPPEPPEILLGILKALDRLK
jgi:Ni,Fe-hydrogenase III small subunit